MKFLISAIFFILLTFCSSSCTERNRYVIGVSQCSVDEWRDKMNMEMQNEAALSQKIDLIILSSNDDTEKQIADIKYLIDQKVDLLILTPNEIAPMTPLIEEIYESGIPVILVDRKIDSDKFSAFIGADNYQIGAEVGRYAVILLNGKGNIVEIKGLTGSSPAIERHRGFYDVLQQYPEMNIVFEGDAGWFRDEGGVQMRKALSAHDKIDLVFVHNDRMAKGAYEEATKVNRAKDIYFIGIDGLPGPGEGIDMVLDNKLEATFLYPTGGDKTIQLATDILEKRYFRKENILATSVIDKTNAKILKLQTDQIVEQQNKILLLNQRINKQLERYVAQRNIMYLISVLAILFCILLIGLFRAYHIKKKLNNRLHESNLEIIKQKNELETNQLQLLALSKQLEEATHAKLAFFTDVSHDFRTPLTLISGPIDVLLETTEPQNENYKWLKIIKKNVEVLLRLVNQIIEFRRIETYNVKLNLTSNDIDDCLKDWNLLFLQLTQKNKIRFHYKTDDSYFTFMFDLEKMERIYFNLLSNAFKFTEKGGNIYVGLSKIIEDEQDFIQITISNTGNGLSDDDINNIFERFYRVESHVTGSGIGLALVKALVELHGGSIAAVSKNNLTTFIVKIPYIKPQESVNKVEDRIVSYEIFLHDKDFEIDDSGFDNETDDKYTMLIVDDNEEIRFYIRSIFRNKYHIIEASDGEEGLHLAYENNIDIIISDVMMPKIDGVELCTKIKEDIRVCHIPIVLLTACSLDEQRIKGFESGADAYISKPFNPQILEVRIQKMLENRQKIRKSLTENAFFQNQNVLNISRLDDELILKFRNYVLERISDTNLNVEDISSEFGFSRAQFYRKMKAITNQGPNEFIRTIRLNRSIEILKSGKTVSEVAYEVGFTSPSYFTKCFKEFFHKNPSEIY
ncbi:substrate-binding domain-containing protein [Prevotella sp. 10(H)]|uniref:hybrid sensor histidine kinase/response regulator transcription factor n=1 Tax=Prevotella sp. 10(H) TaxID=1158294 RepID=UPI0004A73927|nr:substrate-binding domain-containing protein [Prevotella sp. 10(H)]